jgi:hypothetical protein
MLSIKSIFKKHNRNVLRFNISDQIAIDTVSLASSNTPKWYKDIPRFADSDPTKKIFSHTVKQCVPFLEAMTCGYHILLPCDIDVYQNKDGLTEIRWRSSFDPISERSGKTEEYLNVPDGYQKNNSFVWKFPAYLNIPKGYSVLVTHPLNRYDLPFHTLSGVIDGDFTMAIGGNLPFFIKNNFNGVIKRGTPIAHVLPFKQENWELKKEKGIEEYAKQNRTNSTSVIFGWYKDSHWKKKKW